MMKRLSPMDAAFLRMESPRTPMHIGALLTFKLPDDAPRDFARTLLQNMRDQPFLPFPFGCKLGGSKMLPAWEECEPDMDYHLRHSALPYPGGERELGILVARLHSHPMDLSRPPWECHLIEGLENNRFAAYFKAHHAAVDGLGAMKLIKGWLSYDPNHRGGPRIKTPVDDTDEAAGPGGKVRKMLDFTGLQLRSGRELVRNLREMSKGGDESIIKASMNTPKSLFNQPTSQQRRLGTQVLPLERFKAVTKATDTTVNDATLAVCAGAMRRYLLELNALPDKPLIASVPVGLARSDGKAGNAVAGFVVPLGTHIADPAKRLETINAITSRTKEQFMGMSPTALEQLTLLGMSPLIVGQMTGVLSKLPPFFNFVVSNVVASKEKLYLHGAELEAMYPISVLFDGYALNVTIIGYTDRVAIGFTGCRDAIPHLQRLAVYSADALTELEDAVGVAPAAKPRSAKPAPAPRGRRARP